MADFSFIPSRRESGFTVQPTTARGREVWEISMKMGKATCAVFDRAETFAIMDALDAAELPYCVGK